MSRGKDLEDRARRGAPDEQTLLKRSANLKRKNKEADIKGRANLFNPYKKTPVSPVVPGQTYPSEEPVANLAINVEEPVANLTINVEALRDDGNLAMNAEALRDDGNKAFQAGEFQKAIDKYDEAIKIDGMSHFLFGNRSAAFASMKNFQAAFSDAAKAVRLLQYLPQLQSRSSMTHSS